MELFSMPCGQIGSNGAIATGQKKSPQRGLLTLAISNALKAVAM
jgi:hypothetical protein